MNNVFIRVSEMGRELSRLDIVSVGCSIIPTYLKQIGEMILQSFGGVLPGYELKHHSAPFYESIDVYLLTMILGDEFGTHTLGITDADLTTEDSFYGFVFGGMNPEKHVAVVSDKRLSSPDAIDQQDSDLYISRVLKVSLHEEGHNLGLTDHYLYKKASDGSLCPMSRGEANKFGYVGYVRAVIDGRGLEFCDECKIFLERVYTKSCGSLPDA